MGIKKEKWIIKNLYLVVLFVVVASCVFLVNGYVGQGFFEEYSVSVTEEHPFLVEKCGLDECGFEFVAVRELVVGDKLKTIDGRRVEVVEIEEVDVSDVGGVDVYNLDTDRFSDFVLEGGVVVHNSDVPRPRGDRKLEDLVDDFRSEVDAATNELSDYNNFHQEIRKNAMIDEGGVGLENRIGNYRHIGTQFKGDLQYSGVRGSSTSLTEVADLVRMREAYKNDLVPFLKAIDSKFSPETQRVFLGSDGLDYSMLAYNQLSEFESVVRNFEINRMMLSSSEEFSEILDIAIRMHSSLPDDPVKRASLLHKTIDDMLNTQISPNYVGKVRLYDDMNKIIRKSVECNGDYLKNLKKLFDDSIMSKRATKKRVLELIGKLGETVDFKKPIVLIDYSGSKHTQPQLIKEGVEWLKNPKNWNKLTASEKKLLGINYCDIQNAKIEMHLGVVDSPDSKLHGLDLDFIWKTDPNYAGFSDVEGVKSRFIDPYSYFSGDLRWYGTTSYQQAETWIRQMLLNDAIYYP